MVNLEALKAQSLRHYELGRLRMAARITIVLAPLAAVCLLEPIGRETTACCAALLLVASIWLRFRSRAGVESVRAGLLAGAIPLGATLLLTQLAPGCVTAAAVSYCTGFSLLIGATGGAVVALRERAGALLSGSWLVAIGVALLTASLGCVRLGIAGVVGVTIGMLAGRASLRGLAATQR